MRHSEQVCLQVLARPAPFAEGFKEAPERFGHAVLCFNGIIAMAVGTFMLLLRALFRAAKLIIGSGVEVETVGRLLLLTLPNIVVLTIPMALLFAIRLSILISCSS